MCLFLHKAPIIADAGLALEATVTCIAVSTDFKTLHYAAHLSYSCLQKTFVSEQQTLSGLINMVLVKGRNADITSAGVKVVFTFCPTYSCGYYVRSVCCPQDTTSPLCTLPST